ncbi:F-box/FBD/LRR-repeat protein At1g13570-like [Mercurialis annua]|uniref:F-box/FBD/LRR-repeat protein At1g13570-like n=1 Tax=Mercurialis annua TaxID=3986 RepID=UPI00215F8FDF|nr:F-box/FBD/LRR-repeat protein At1g13570-like [Mercurialis annua]
MEGICAGSDVDRISDLPGNVIAYILACLPLEDAVRTGILSQKWKEQWYKVPRIIVDESIFHERYKAEMEGIISYILTQHEGNLKKFSAYVDQVKDHHSMKLWIFRLSQKSIQEFTILIQKGRCHEVPSDLFSLQQLRELNLRHLKVQLPHSFKGFHNLVFLRLVKVDITPSAFNKLIASCLHLEELVLQKLNCIGHLHINLPSLKNFSFNGEFKSISFQTPLLEVLSINLFWIGSENNPFDLRFKFRGLPSAIKELYVRCQFQKFLAAGDTFTQVSTSYKHLKTLELRKFCFEKLDDISCFISLMESSLNLEIIDITACDCENGAESEAVLKFWEDRKNSSLSFKRLQKATVRSFRGKDHEVKFIEFLLANSHVLRDMTVECMDNPDFDEDEIKAVRLWFCQGSSKLKFIGDNYDSSSDES